VGTEKPGGTEIKWDTSAFADGVNLLADNIDTNVTVPNFLTVQC
jgi:hypothetical protein